MDERIKIPCNVKVVCPLCGRESSVIVDHNDYIDWIKRRGPVQKLFPYLSADKRELLISGTCSECWDKEFNLQ